MNLSMNMLSTFSEIFSFNIRSVIWRSQWKNALFWLPYLITASSIFFPERYWFPYARFFSVFSELKESDKRWKIFKAIPYGLLKTMRGRLNNHSLGFDFCWSNNFVAGQKTGLSMLTAFAISQSIYDKNEIFFQKAARWILPGQLWSISSVQWERVSLNGHKVDNAFRSLMKNHPRCFGSLLGLVEPCFSKSVLPLLSGKYSAVVSGANLGDPGTPL